MSETARFGRIERGRHVLPLRVYWEDTDASGIVYYANYLRFVERARSDMLRFAGISQQRLFDETGLALAVRSCAVEYLRPARLDDELEVHSHLTALRGASLTARQQVMRRQNELVRADIRIACIDKQGRPTRLPAQVVAALSGFAAAGIDDDQKDELRNG